MTDWKPRQIKLIEHLYQRMRQNFGHSVSYRRRGREVYTLYREHIEGHTHILLLHYGTPILRYNLTQKTIAYFYGESNSDRDAVNSLLYYELGERRFRFRLRQGSMYLASVADNDAALHFLRKEEELT